MHGTCCPRAPCGVRSPVSGFRTGLAAARTIPVVQMPRWRRRTRGRLLDRVERGLVATPSIVVITPPLLARRLQQLFREAVEEQAARAPPFAAPLFRARDPAGSRVEQLRHRAFSTVRRPFTVPSRAAGPRRQRPLLSASAFGRERSRGESRPSVRHGVEDRRSGSPSSARRSPSHRGPCGYGSPRITRDRRQSIDVGLFSSSSGR